MLYLFFIVSSFLIFIELIIYRRLVTTFNVFLIPFYVIISFLSTFGQYFGYKELSQDCLLIVLLSAMSFWVGDKVSLTAVSTIKTNISSQPRYVFNLDKVRSILWCISFVVIVCSTFMYVEAKPYFGDEKQYVALTGTGILAHIRLMAYPIFVFFLIEFLDTRKLKYFIISAVGFSINFLSFVKYHTILPVLTLIHLIILFKTNIKKRYVAGLFLFVFLIFFGTYSILLFPQFKIDPIAHLQWVALHMTDYIVAGVINFGSLVGEIEGRWFGMNELLIVSFPKAFNAKIGNILEVPVIAFQEIRPEGYSNIGTTLYLPYYFLGIYGLILWVFFIGLFSGLLQILAFEKKNALYKALLCHVMGILFLSFFSNYFTLLAPWEYGIWIIIFFLLGERLPKLRLQPTHLFK